MSTIEIVFPNLKKGPDVIKTVDRDVLPNIFKEFKTANVLDGVHGWIESEDGRDVSSEIRKVVILQWPHPAAFQAFITSDNFANVKSLLMPIAEAPSAPKLFDASDASNFFSADPVLEILEILPKAGLAQGGDVGDILRAIQSVLKDANPKTVYGSSLNLEKKQAVVTRLFASRSELATEVAGASRRELLARLSELAEVTQLVANVARIPLN